MACSGTSSLRPRRAGPYTIGDGVAFLGRDRDDIVRSVTIRFFEAQAHGTAFLTKRDLRGSDKAFPVVFRGCQERVVVVEGSLTGLAVQSLAALVGREPPTVVVTGGVNALKWVTEPRTPAARLVAGAAELIVACENELLEDGQLDEAKQGATDAARGELSRAIAGIRQEPPRMAYPPAGCRDAADWLVRLRRHRGA